MTRKPRRLSRKAKQAELLRLVGIVREFYGMAAWKISFTWLKTMAETDDGDGRAQCSATPEYMEAELQFVLDAIRDDELTEIVTHELLHPLLWPMTAVMDRWAGTDPDRQEAARLALETTTSWLDRILTPVVSAYVALHDGPPAAPPEADRPIAPESTSGAGDE